MSVWEAILLIVLLQLFFTSVIWHVENESLNERYGPPLSDEEAKADSIDDYLTISEDELRSRIRAVATRRYRPKVNRRFVLVMSTLATALVMLIVW